MKEVIILWSDVYGQVNKWVSILEKKPVGADVVLGVARGGVVPGYLFANSYWSSLSLTSHAKFKIVEPFAVDCLKEFKDKKVILVDDIYDTGATAKFFKEEAKRWNIDMQQLFIVDKPLTDVFLNGEKDVWYRFPWETKVDTVGGRQQAAVTLLRSIGENLQREGLKDTPKRVAKMWDELCSGYNQKPEEVLKTTFSAEGYDEMVVMKGIHFFSLCEHHMLPFFGEIDFAYLPDKKVVGASKIVRLVDVFSRRLQIQERLTTQIGEAFSNTVKPKGVGVVVRALHLCMVMRGVRKEQATMVTSHLSGSFRKDAITRNEFLGLIGK